jgi:hypothetical protein
VAGGQHCGDAMIVNVAFTLVFNTGVLPDVCRTWQVRAVANTILTQFKVDFTTVHCEFRMTNHTA